VRLGYFIRLLPKHQNDMVEFEIVWQRIRQLQGEQFTTIKGLPFTFTVDGDALYPSRTEYRLSKNDVETVFNLVPISGPGVVNDDVRGPSYLWAILHDHRVSKGEW
jgi:hypothetical protein